MKDYTLSEVKAMCESRETCVDCPLMILTSHGIGCLFWIMPLKWQNGIERRDMIELPCKIKVAYLDDVFAWQVVRRNKNGDVETVNEIFGTEADADAFLEKIKGQNK